MTDLIRVSASELMVADEFGSVRFEATDRIMKADQVGDFQNGGFSRGIIPYGYVTPTIHAIDVPGVLMVFYPAVPYTQVFSDALYGMMLPPCDSIVMPSAHDALRRLPTFYAIYPPQNSTWHTGGTTDVEYIESEAFAQGQTYEDRRVIGSIRWNYETCSHPYIAGNWLVFSPVLTITEPGPYKAGRLFMSFDLPHPVVGNYTVVFANTIVVAARDHNQSPLLLSA